MRPAIRIAVVLPTEAARHIVERAIEAQAALDCAGARELHGWPDDAPCPPLPTVHQASAGYFVSVYDADWLEDLLYRLEEQYPDMGTDLVGAERRRWTHDVRAARGVALALRMAAAAVGHVIEDWC